MIALYIFLGILAFLLLLLLCKATVCIGFCREIEVKIKYLFLRFTVYKGVIGRKEEGKPRHAEEQKEKKPGKKKKKKEGEKPKLKRPPLGELIDTALAAVKKTLKKLGRSAKLEKAFLRCRVASPDPAKTAVLYGAVSGTAGNIFALLGSIKRRSKKCGAIDFAVEPDFIAEEFDLAADIRVSFIPLKLLIAAISGWLGYRKVKKLWKPDPAGNKKKNEESDITEENEKGKEQSHESDAP